jgi:hypothetical protein
MENIKKNQNAKRIYVFTSNNFYLKNTKCFSFMLFLTRKLVCLGVFPGRAISNWVLDGRERVMVKYHKNIRFSGFFFVFIYGHGGDLGKTTFTKNAIHTVLRTIWCV